MGTLSGIKTILARARPTIPDIARNKSVVVVVDGPAVYRPFAIGYTADESRKSPVSYVPSLIRIPPAMINVTSYFTEHLPDALSSGCTKCSEKQRRGSEKVIRFLVNKVWAARHFSPG